MGTNKLGDNAVSLAGAVGLVNIPHERRNLLRADAAAEKCGPASLEYGYMQKKKAFRTTTWFETLSE